MDKKKIAIIAVIIFAIAALIAAAVLLYPVLSEKVSESEKEEVEQAAKEEAEAAREAAKKGFDSTQDETSAVLDTGEIDADRTATFYVYDSSGNKVDLADRLGKKPVIVNCWATWCPPCRNELPDFNEAYENHGEEIEFMMVNLMSRDTVESATELAKENGYTFPMYFDVDGSISQSYSLQYIPVTLVFDKDGILLKNQVGMMTRQELDVWIDILLEK